MRNIMRLGDVASYVNGFPFKPSDWSDMGVPIIRIQDLTGNGYQMNRFDGKYDAKYEVRAGDVLISWSASLGVYVWKLETAVLNQHIFKVRFDKVDVDKDFFVYQVECLLKKAARQAHGATMRHLTKPVFDGLPFYLPPKEEQKRIAVQLNAITRLISIRQRQAEKLDELVKARFVEMFGDPVRNTKRFPQHELKEYIQFLTSGSRGWAKFFSDDGELFITIKNVKNGHINLSDIQHVMPPDNAEAKRTKVQAGDLLISITADLGRTGVVSDNLAQRGAYINQHLTCIRLKKDEVLPQYVSAFLESAAGKRQFSAKNQSAVKAGLNFEAIKSLRLFMPPLELQREYIAFVNEVDREKERIQRSAALLETLKRSLMQQYFG